MARLSKEMKAKLLRQVTPDNYKSHFIPQAEYIRLEPKLKKLYESYENIQGQIGKLEGEVIKKRSKYNEEVKQILLTFELSLELGTDTSQITKLIEDTKRSLEQIKGRLLK